MVSRLLMFSTLSPEELVFHIGQLSVKLEVSPERGLTHTLVA